MEMGCTAYTAPAKDIMRFVREVSRCTRLSLTIRLFGSFIAAIGSGLRAHRVWCVPISLSTLLPICVHTMCRRRLFRGQGKYFIRKISTIADVADWLRAKEPNSNNVYNSTNAK